MTPRKGPATFAPKVFTSNKERKARLKSTVSRLSRLLVVPCQGLKRLPEADLLRVSEQMQRSKHSQRAHKGPARRLIAKLLRLRQPLRKEP